MLEPIHILGGGLAGCEAAWQVSRAGCRAILHEMRPNQSTPAHKTGQLAELVCSNSLKSESENTAPWLLKQEIRQLGSLLLDSAAKARVPGGQALTVDRDVFAAGIAQAIESAGSIEVRRQEVTTLPDGIVVVATGPLTSDALATEIARLTGSERLFFYDSISPIVDAGAIDMSVAFRASRYDKSLDGTGDYINCPFDKAQYEAFVDALLEAQSHTPHIADDIPGQKHRTSSPNPRAVRAESHGGSSRGKTGGPAYFEACLPIEELARRGRDTPRFGPMKPVGLTDPRTGRRPWAAVQLRQENLRADSYNLVGFQNYLKHGEQKRIFRMIPGLEHAEFLRYGQIHRNTYINAPALLTPTLQLRSNPKILFAGQISGVEGYVEAIATGLMAGRNAAALATGATIQPLPRQTALGSLSHYVAHADPGNYQPANITFDLLPTLDEETRRRFGRDKRARKAEVCRRALAALEEHLAAHV